MAGAIFPWREGNHFELLIDGPQFFPRMLVAIARAEEQVELELYLVEAGACAEAMVQALITTQIDLRPINDLAPGAQLELRLPLTVDLHGKQHQYNAELLATRLDDRRIQVVTLEPLVINAEDFDLAPGLESLRKVAGLSAISLSVPVGAVLIFTAR